MDKIIIIFILLLISILYVCLVFIKDNLKAVFISSILSILYVILHTYLLALDVAMTEIVVGISISTIILLFSLKTKNEENSVILLKGSNVLAFFVTLIALYIIILYIDEVPVLWDKKSVVHGDLLNFYINQTKEYFGFNNVVTAILAGFRGMDTLGETIVVFISGISILLFLQSDNDE